MVAEIQNIFYFLHAYKNNNNYINTCQIFFNIQFYIEMNNTLTNNNII